MNKKDKNCIKVKKAKNLSKEWDRHRSEEPQYIQKISIKSMDL